MEKRMARRVSRLIEPHLQTGESVEVSLRGLITGYTRRSTIGSTLAVVVLFVIVSALRLATLAALAALLAAIVGVFFLMLRFVGRPMARRNDPVLESPYIVLVLTNRRVLLIEQAAGGEISRLVEDSALGQISELDYVRGSILSPQRLTYRTSLGKRSFEFPRVERVQQFVTALDA